jgi:hypothetical protein
MTNIDQRTGEIFDDGDIEVLPPGGGLSVFSGEVDRMIATSKQYPRPKDKAISIKILERATLSSDIAEECLYDLPRDNKRITGPSIRFAEIIRSCYRNIWVRSWVVEEGAAPDARAIKVAALAYDCENNEAESAEVRRSIMTSPKNGPPRKYSADMVNTTIMAAQAIARRNAILALIPKALWIDGLNAVERVIKGDEKTLNERRTKILEDFKKFGVQPDQLFQALNIESEQEIGLNDLPQLRGMWARLNDNESVESVLGQAARRPTHQTVANPMSNDAPPHALPDDTEAAGKAAEKAAPKRGRPPKQQPATAAPAQQASTSQQPDNPADDPRQNENPNPDEGIAVDSEPDGRNREAEQRQEQIEAQGDSVDRTEVRGDGVPSFLDRRSNGISEYAGALKYINDFKGSAGELLDWWRKLSGARAKMSFEENGHLGKVYNAKFMELNK